jgi:tetratricopeptide (TPR) repeat protein
MLDRALDDGQASLVAMIGPGGQGKTAIVQHWLQRVSERIDTIDGLFLWSFYRGKDSDLCLRELFAYAEGMDHAPEVSAGFCVDRLLPRLRRERWALVLDGTEIVQHESGAWYGRFVHPELGRLLEELASAMMPGVVVMTSRFDMPTLAQRRHAKLVSLATLDEDSGVGLLRSLGVRGSDAQLRTAASAAGLHAKAVELLGTWLVRYHAGDVAHESKIAVVADAEASPEERHVARILGALHGSMAEDLKDALALATAFRQPPTQTRFLEYLISEPVHHLLHEVWRRRYRPFRERGAGELAAIVDELTALRLLERVGLTLGPQGNDPAAVLDAHPLVRRGFEGVLGAAGGTATARAGFLRGRPDRRPPGSLEEAREEVELFHAYIEAGLWSEADGTLVALDNPKHRFLAPAFERDLLVRFFPAGDWRRPPLWSGFGRYRSLAICCELLGEFDAALDLYRPADAPLRGDALIALGRLDPLLSTPQVPHPWQMLWQAYRAHALALAGHADEALRTARAAVPIDIYEWVHVFEAMLRLGRLDLLDMNSVLYQPTLAAEHRWAGLARRRMCADYTRLSRKDTADLGSEYRELLDAYDRAGLPWERALTRLSYSRWLAAAHRHDEAGAIASAALEIARRHGMRGLEIDALTQIQPVDEASLAALRHACGWKGPPRP